MSRLPSWIRSSLRTESGYAQVDHLMSSLGLHTVCESARCPNKHECWNRATATVMILGDTCTRNCLFCAVKTGLPGAVDAEEPGKVARAAKTLGLRHVVLTSVTRDDLPDGGAAHFSETILAIRRECPNAAVEVLTPDFKGNSSSLQKVFLAQPDVFNHNLETVERLQATIRPQASYRCSLGVLKQAAEWRPTLRVKSGLMLGLGETEEELMAAMNDLLTAGCSLLTLGQYLAPSRRHVPVAHFYAPAEFEHWADRARQMGFKEVAAGPMVRSSYKADELARRATDPKAEA
ncbi:MAG TPA: lipoyl synthase [Verrucomicrobia bacterium]|nr:lipoyl synthase [Verrucomicrobiota bacterium]